MTRTEGHLVGHVSRRISLFGLSLILAMGVTLMTSNGVAHAFGIISRWHTTFGNHLYITTDGTTPYGAAESGNPPGRILTSVSGASYNDPSGECPNHSCTEWALQLDSGYCLGAVNTNNNIDIKPCGTDGTTWALLPTTDSSYEWINVEISNLAGADYVITGDNVVGDRLTNDCQGCHSGTYQKWFPVNA